MTLCPHKSHMVCKNSNRIKIPQYLTHYFALRTRREQAMNADPSSRSWGSVKGLILVAFTSRRCDIHPYFGRLEPLTLQRYAAQPQTVCHLRTYFSHGIFISISDFGYPLVTHLEMLRYHQPLGLRVAEVSMVFRQRDCDWLFPPHTIGRLTCLR